jgi:hypothetical protein
MKKEEMIIHWMDIAAAVFRAEEAIRETWMPILREAAEKKGIEAQHTCDAYLRAVATEIVENINIKFDEE